MGNTNVYYCKSCGSALDTSINREFVFCQYCGAKNEIANQAMETSINVGSVSIKAKTDVDSLINSAEYAASINQFDKANEILISAIMSGTNDYRIYAIKARIDLIQDNNKSLFESLKKLKELESKQSSENEVTNSIRELMQYRGKNGVTALHNATFHEMMDWVVFCVEHGADVNCLAGTNRVSPISIMFVPISSSLTKLDGTPFVRSKAKVKEIRSYLMAHGGKDKFRLGF